MSATDTKTKTSYIVLKQLTRASTSNDTTNMAGGKETWEPLDTVYAHSAQAAIQACAEKATAIANGNHAKETATLIAIPERSWQPRKVTVKQVARVTVEDA